MIVKKTNGNADTEGHGDRAGPGVGHPGRRGQLRDHHGQRGSEDRRPSRSDLVGKNVDDAEDELVAAGFTNVTKKEATSESPDDKANAVLSVSPSGGSTAALDADITLTFATGKSEVPNLTERLYDAAQSEAEQAGFKVEAGRPADRRRGREPGDLPEPGGRDHRLPRHDDQADRGGPAALAAAADQSAPAAPDPTATPE